MRRFRSPASETGLTLVELLVCMLIIGIMAAIALPAFLDQRAKGEDAEAKLTLKTAVTAMVTYEMNAGTYGASVSDLEAIEPTLRESRKLTVVSGDADSFEISEDSAAGTTFTLSRDAEGKVTRDCSEPAYGLCRAGLDADGNRW
jgi:type IV pilus assembly protein PilA